MGSGEEKLVHLVAAAAVVLDVCLQRQVYLSSMDVPLFPSQNPVSLLKEAAWTYMGTSLRIVNRRYHCLLVT